MLGIFSDSSPQQKLAAMRYLWFVTSEEAQRIRTDVYVEGGFGKFVNPKLLEQFGYERLLRQVPEGWLEAFEVAMNNGVPEPYGSNTQFIYRDMSEPINTALAREDLGRMPRDQAIDWIHGLLEAKAAEVNQGLGEMPAEQLMVRRIVGTIVMLLVAGAFAFGMWRVWAYFTAVAAPFEAQAGWRKYAWGYILLAPALGLIVFWAYLPLLGGLGLAFMDYEMVIDTEFVGVDNFAEALFDEDFWLAMMRTIYFVALTIGLGFWPPILLAILLDEVPTTTAKYVFRTIYYLPAIISGVIMIFLWRQLYNPTEHGALNQLLMSVNVLGPVAATLVKWVLLALWLSLIGLLVWLPIKMDEMSWPIRLSLWCVALAFLGATLWPLIEAYRGGPGATVAGVAGVPAVLGALSHLWGRFDLEPVEWIHSPELAMLCAVIPTVWAASGPGCILYLAALKTVPEDMYEAAAIDGAGTWQKVCHITLPRLKYLIVIQFIAAVIGAFKGGADYILALTGGGPNGATMILALEIFLRTFMDLRFGLGAAMAWILGAMLIAFTAYQLRMLSRAEFRTAQNVK